MNFLNELAKSLDPQKVSTEEEDKTKKIVNKPNVTATRVPFHAHTHSNKVYTVDQSILEAINEITITEDHFRSSAQLTLLLNDIVPMLGQAEH